jgi:hypothetical protein
MLIYKGLIKINITSLKGNYLTSTLLKNYFMPIHCSPVKSRLSARLTVRLTKITFFRCLSRNTASPIRRRSRWPLGSLTQMIKGHSRAGSFARAETLVGSAWDWSDWRVCRRCERNVAVPLGGEKEMGWYENDTRVS